MHTSRYQPSASRPASAGASLIILGTIAFGATLVGPKIGPIFVPDPPLTTTNIPIDPPPPPDPQPTHSRTTPTTQPLPNRPKPIVTIPSPADPIGTTTDPVPPPTGPIADPGPPTTGPAVDPPKAPVMVRATVDPRYADALQPPYPPSEIRAQTEGRLIARVLVGVDGRVKALDIISSPSDALAKATRSHAFSRWRFKPATRDGVPYEDWMTMTLHFRLVD